MKASLNKDVFLNPFLPIEKPLYKKINNCHYYNFNNDLHYLRAFNFRKSTAQRSIWSKL